jgi:glutamate-1-semialdehyde aminotransferase
VTTYALGKVAREYYAGGRTLDAARLKQVFATMAEEAKTLQAKLATQIQEKAKTLDTSNIASVVRDA